MPPIDMGRKFRPGDAVFLQAFDMPAAVFDDPGDRPAKLAATADMVSERLNAPLPVRHLFVGRGAMFGEDQLSARLQRYPSVRAVFFGYSGIQFHGMSSSMRLIL